MKAPFEIDAETISRLNKIEFADVLNRLLRAEASQKGLSQHHVYTSSRIDDPDGGVDAAVRDCAVVSEWVPEGNSVWQFKSGKITPAKIKKEFNEAPTVQEEIEKGATYVLCIGADLNYRTKRDREQAIAECFAAKELTPKFKVLGASEIAEWASQHLAICFLPQFQRPLGALMLWQRWGQDNKFQQEFQSDPARTTIRREIRLQLETDGDVFHRRIEGQPGIGKTRLALEIFRPESKEEGFEDGFHQRVLYAASFDDVPFDLFPHVEGHPKVELILVVDECSRDQWDRLERQAQRSNGRLKLLTIGLAQEVRPTATSSDTYMLDRLGDKSMGELLQKDYSRLPTETLNVVVRWSSGFVKLAVTLAGAILDHPEKASARDLMQTQEMQDVIAKFLIPEEADRCALQVVSLLSRIGWEGDVAPECQAVVEFMDLNLKDVQRRIGRFVAKGFVARQGRYRYVTPHPLAVTLAAQAWDAYGEETVKLITKLPTLESRRALLERLHDLGDDPQAKRVTEMLLVEGGAFPSLFSISESGRADIFALLAEINPLAGLSALQRLIEHLPRSELLTFHNGRRQVVHLLEKLAWSKQTFFGAMRLLLQLADTENEAWGNNASGVWVGLFGTFLGGTAVPAQERHILIHEALDSPSEAQQRLAVRAIAHIFSLHEGRSSWGENQGGRLVEPEWHPGNYAEERAVRESGLVLLDRALVHDNPEIRIQARNILLKQGRELAHRGFAEAVIERIERQPWEDLGIRYELLQMIDSLLEFEGKIIPPDQKQRLTAFRAQVVGSSFADRLRRWTGRSTIADWKRSKEPGGRTMEQEAIDLADESLCTPDLLRPELSFLATEAPAPYAFGKRLGERDADHQWWNEIEAFVRVGQGYAFASAYLQGNVEAGRHIWRDMALDTWVATGSRELALGVFDAIWRTDKPDDVDAKRLIALLDRGCLEAARVGSLIMGGLTKYFSSEVFAQLVERVLREDNEAVTASALALIHQRLDFHREDEPILAQYAWRALESRDALSGDTMTQHYAQELAQRYLVDDPVRMAHAILRHLEVKDHSLLRSDTPIQILEQATALQPKAVWEKVATWLTSDHPNRLQVYLALQGWYAQVVGAEIVLEWAEQHLPDGPELVAAFTAVWGNPMELLPRELLIRYGQDEKVASELYGNFQSGSFWGNTSQWLEGHDATAKSWTNDPHPKVRAWAQRLVDSLEKQIVEWKLVEVERGY